jgi:Arc/MetJ family transcription regulator
VGSSSRDPPLALIAVKCLTQRREGANNLRLSDMAYLNIDKDLLAEAQKLGGHKTKSETVNAALREYIERRQRQLAAVETFGQFDWDLDYDYKQERRRKRGGADK